MSSITGIIIATKTEASPFIDGLGLKKIGEEPVAVYSEGSTVLALSGIGKSNAAIAATHLIERHGPCRIINLGSAGAAGNRFAIGDRVHIDEVYELDRPRLATNSPMKHKPDMLSGFTTASLATQDHAILGDDERLAAGKYADLVDMEGAAVIQACRAFGVDVYLFKVVTDAAGSSIKEIIRNILSTRDSLFMFYRDQVLPLL